MIVRQGLAGGGSRAYVDGMRSPARIEVLMALVAVVIAASQSAAYAQSQPTIVAPGAQAPIITSPPPPSAFAPKIVPFGAAPPSQSAPPVLDTFGDRVSRCTHYSGVQGLPPGQSDSYIRACGND